MTSQLSLLHFCKSAKDASAQKGERRNEGCTALTNKGWLHDVPVSNSKLFLRELRWMNNILEALEERAERRKKQWVLRQVYRIVAQLEANRSCGAGRDEIIAAAEMCGISRQEAEKALETLHAQGDIFECRRRHHKTL